MILYKAYKFIGIAMYDQQTFGILTLSTASTFNGFFDFRKASVIDFKGKLFTQSFFCLVTCLLCNLSHHFRSIRQDNRFAGLQQPNNHKRVILKQNDSNYCICTTNYNPSYYSYLLIFTYKIIKIPAKLQKYLIQFKYFHINFLPSASTLSPMLFLLFSCIIHVSESVKRLFIEEIK